MVAGLRMARGRYVCVMDADLQHPPELRPGAPRRGRTRRRPRGRQPLRAGREPRGARRAPVRRLVSREATVVARLLFNEARQSSDPLSGFFLCRRALIDGIEFRPVGFKILLELLVCVPELRVVDVPMTQAARSTGRKQGHRPPGAPLPPPSAVAVLRRPGIGARRGSSAWWGSAGSACSSRSSRS